MRWLIGVLGGGFIGLLVGAYVILPNVNGSFVGLVLAVLVAPLVGAYAGMQLMLGTRRQPPPP